MSTNERNAARLPFPAPAEEPRKPAAPAAVPALTSATPDAISLLKALHRRWFLAGALGILLAGIVGTAAWILLPAHFTAFALLQVSSKPTQFGERIINREDFLIYMKTTAARLKSRDVLMRHLEPGSGAHLGLIKKFPDTLSTLTWMEEYLKIEIQDSSELLTVSLTGEDPNDLQTIVNHMVKSFMTIIGNEDKSRNKDRLEKSKFLYESAKEKLAEKVIQKDALLKSQEVKDPWAMMNLLQNMQMELRQAQGEYANRNLELERKLAQQTNLQAIKKDVAKVITEPTQKELLDFDADLRKDMEQVERLEKIVETLIKEGHRPDEATRRQMEEKLGKSKKKVEERISQARADLHKKARTKYEGELDQVIANLKTDIEPLAEIRGRDA